MPVCGKDRSLEFRVASWRLVLFQRLESYLGKDLLVEADGEVLEKYAIRQSACEIEVGTDRCIDLTGRPPFVFWRRNSVAGGFPSESPPFLRRRSGMRSSTSQSPSVFKYQNGYSGWWARREGPNASNSLRRGDSISLNAKSRSSPAVAFDSASSNRRGLWGALCPFGKAA